MRKIRRRRESDMPSRGMAYEMNRSGSYVLLHGEVVAFAVPLLRLAMPQAHRDRAVMSPKRLHLPSPVAVVTERAMHEEQGLALPALDERHVNDRSPAKPAVAAPNRRVASMRLERGSRKRGKSRPAAVGRSWGGQDGPSAYSVRKPDWDAALNNLTRSAPRSVESRPAS